MSKHTHLTEAQTDAVIGASERFYRGLFRPEKGACITEALNGASQLLYHVRAVSILVRENLNSSNPSDADLPDALSAIEFMTEAANALVYASQNGVRGTE